MDKDTPVIFSRRGGLGVATLNLPKALNALNLEMIDLLARQLDEWAEDDDVAAVWIDGSGEKGLCAGGDVVALYRESPSYADLAGDDLAEGRAPDLRFSTEFFSREYRLDYRIHTYPKPVVVWGGGIVMGGGIGILAGASHRIVTETTRMAMPEVTIGLFPDVGGSWFLNRMPGRLGLFLGLTGAQFNGADALFAGLADRVIENGHRWAVLDALAELAYSTDSEENRSLIDECLKGLQIPAGDRPQSNLRAHYDQIQQLTDYATLPQVCRAITGYDGEDVWLRKAASTLAAGSPLTPWIVWEQLRRGSRKSLGEIFRMELMVAVNLCASGHFREGVRALLVDKDREPQWQPCSLEDISAEQVEQCFRAPWQGESPLAEL